MKSTIFAVSLFFLITGVKAQSLFESDTFTYTVNLDLNQNNYLKSVPIDLLSGYCKGYWNAFYPNKEMNQCLFDDFIQRFNVQQISINNESMFCYEDYCSNSSFAELYSRFSRKLQYKEVIYYDAQHSKIKREVLWVQLYYSVLENETWKHYNGPIFWLFEQRKAKTPVQVNKKPFSSDSWTLEKEFNFPGFITNENKSKIQRENINKYDGLEEN